MFKGSSFSTSPPRHIFFMIVILIGVRCYLIVVCNLHLPNDQWRWESFWVLFGLFYISFGEIAIQIFCLVINHVVCYCLFLSCRSSLYIRDISLLPDLMCTYFGCLFTLLIESFNAQKLLHLIQSSLSIFIFIACGFGVMFKKYC